MEPRRAAAQIVFVLAVAAIFSLAQASRAGWWNESFPYRQNVTFAMPSGEAPEGYQAQIILNSENVGGNFSWENGCSDLRFRFNGNEISYWVESCRGDARNASIWVRLPFRLGAQPQSIEMYYGNSSIESGSNGTGVFDFYEDFEEGSLAAAHWAKYDEWHSGDASVAQGFSHRGLFSARLHTSNAIISIDAPARINYSDADLEWWVFSTGAGYGYTDDYSGISYGPCSKTRESIIAVTGIGDDSVSDSAEFFRNNPNIMIYPEHPVGVWMRMRIVYNESAGTADHYIYDAAGNVLGSSTGVHVTSRDIACIRISGRGYTVDHTLYYDDVILRKFVEGAPRASLSVEEYFREKPTPTPAPTAVEEVAKQAITITQILLLLALAAILLAIAGAYIYRARSLATKGAPTACGRCGAVVPGGHKKCPVCGAAMRKKEEAGKQSKGRVQKQENP